MTASKSFLEELNEAVLRGSAESREKALWYATDMLMVGGYTEDEIWTFGEVIGRLADAIEAVTRAQLATRMAYTVHAPMNIIQKLAFDDSIDVAGPILQHNERLDAKTLVKNIRTKSQSHLLAISKRKSIPSAVTDELVTRGNREVVTSVASNSGACISNFGFLQMIRRSTGDSILTESLGRRKDIPRPMFQQLIAKASAEVRQKLELERPDLVGEIHASVTEVAGALQSKFGPATKDYFAAKRIVNARHRLGELNESVIIEYARAHKIEEATVGLSLISSLPFSAVEHALADPAIILILAKSQNFVWETTMALLFLGAKDHRINERDLENKKNEFSRLDRKTSQEVLSFYKSRRHASSARSGQRRLPQLHSS
jgi:uncharacterized protein (DUF2336 family)